MKLNLKNLKSIIKTIEKEDNNYINYEIIPIHFEGADINDDYKIRFLLNNEKDNYYKNINFMYLLNEEDGIHIVDWDDNLIDTVIDEIEVIYNIKKLSKIYLNSIED